MMTQVNDKSKKEILQEALKNKWDFLKETVRIILLEVIEEERDIQVGVLSNVRDNTKRKVNQNVWSTPLRQYK